MKSSKLRRRIASEAARLMYEEGAALIADARRKAAWRFGVHLRTQPHQLPSDAEIELEMAAYTQRQAATAAPVSPGDSGGGPALLHADPFLVWALLLPPLEAVRQDVRLHPEGDALFHSLQAFELARSECPYDAELVAAALLHDVGKAIDPTDHVAAGLDALHGTLTEREEFLIAHHMDALAYRQGTLGAKLRRRLRASEWFDDLLLLRAIDDRARVPGAPVGTVTEALEWLQCFEQEVEAA
ncbi:MAG: phosphohydrolase [Phycisphaerales bacterium]|nr:phosphohydrolase [Phycisphaerales bacterium]